MCLLKATLLLRTSQVLPSFPFIRNSLALSPFERHPVTSRTLLFDLAIAPTAIIRQSTILMLTLVMSPPRFLRTIHRLYRVATDILLANESRSSTHGH